MTLTCKVTGREFETKEELVEELIGQYVNVQREKYILQTAEVQLIAELSSLAEEQDLLSDSNTKVTTLNGTTQCVKLTPRTNVTYSKTVEGLNLLEELTKKYPQQMSSLVRIDYKEKGTQIEKLLADPPSDDIYTELVSLLNEHRQTKNGKPSIKVEEKK